MGYASVISDRNRVKDSFIKCRDSSVIATVLITIEKWLMFYREK
jgi:hypothetical protein